MSRHVGLALGVLSAIALDSSGSAQSVGAIWYCAAGDAEPCHSPRCRFERLVRLEINTQRRRMKLWHPLPVLMEGPYRGHLETGARAVVELNASLMPIAPPAPEWHAVTVEVNRETRQFTLYTDGDLITGSCRFDRPR